MIPLIQQEYGYIGHLKCNTSGHLKLVVRMIQVTGTHNQSTFIAHNGAQILPTFGINQCFIGDRTHCFISSRQTYIKPARIDTVYFINNNWFPYYNIGNARTAYLFNVRTVHYYRQNIRYPVFPLGNVLYRQSAGISIQFACFNGRRSSCHFIVISRQKLSGRPVFMIVVIHKVLPSYLIVHIYITLYHS